MYNFKSTLISSRKPCNELTLFQIAFQLLNSVRRVYHTFTKNIIHDYCYRLWLDLHITVKCTSTISLNFSQSHILSPASPKVIVGLGWQWQWHSASVECPDVYCERVFVCAPARRKTDGQCCAGAQGKRPEVRTNQVRNKEDCGRRRGEIGTEVEMEHRGMFYN